MKRIRELLERLRQDRIDCRENIPMAPYTTFHIGGLAALLIEPHSAEQLALALKRAREYEIPSFVLGKGSNVLFGDGALPLAVIRTTAVQNGEIRQNTLVAACGATLWELTRQAMKNGLAGMEFAYGIPGTLGGALCMNAGAYGGEMSQVVRSVRVYDAERDDTFELTADQMQFAYRHSILLQNGALTALDATIELHEDDPGQIEARMQDYMCRRKQKQPLDYPSAGSTFKRPTQGFAGQLIEQSGLKGFRIGGAMVSPKHAGFIINVGGATAEDVLRLIEHVRQTVLRDHGVQLEPEVQILTRLNAR